MPGTPISVSPKLPSQGDSMTITSAPSTTYTIEWDPPGPPTSATTNASGIATVTVPSNATSYIVSGGGASPVSGTVAP